MKNLIIILSLLLIPIISFAQGNWTYFTKKEGLLSNKVNKTFADQRGNVWFFTRKGMSRFDGVKWFSYENYILATLSKFQAFEDSNGNIWFWLKNGTNSLVMFDGNDLSYQKKLGLKFDIVNAVTEDSKGRIWIGGANIIALFDSGKWHYYKIKGYVTNLYKDTKGNMWITSDVAVPKDGFIYKTNSDALLASDNEDELLTSVILGLPNNTIIFEDGSGNIWVNGWWTTYIPVLGETSHGGLIQLNGEEWKQHEVDPGRIYVLLEESENNIWAFSDKGTFIFNGDKWKQAWRMGKINTFLKDNGTIWIGLSLGIGKHENGKWKFFRPGDGFGGVNVIFKDSKGNIWFGGDNVYLLKNDKWVMKNGKPGLLKLSDVSNIIEDQAGNIWISTEKKGVVRYSEK